MPKDPSYKKVFQRIKAKKPRDLDQQFHQAHEEVFENFDCLTCANCCKTTSPIWNETDIQRVSKLLKLKVSDFLDKYLQKDSDGDWVFQSAPCPFLDADNYCQIYHDRPRACKEYPHTDRKNMMGILGLTAKNVLICPAVAQIMDKLERKY
jgi:Fe-S-cluster containining protein